MPNLKDLACHVQWADVNVHFQEYGTVYGDGVVETFITVPNHPHAFTIRLTSRRYVAEGLSAIIFIDGNYQCNRNRVNLHPYRKGVPKTRTEIDFVLRQQEEPIGEGMYIGREWRFDDDNIVLDLPQGGKKSHSDFLGTIEVLVLRCRSTQPDEASSPTTSSGADSTVLDIDVEGKGKDREDRQHDPGSSGRMSQGQQETSVNAGSEGGGRDPLRRMGGLDGTCDQPCQDGPDGDALSPGYYGWQGYSQEPVSGPSVDHEGTADFPEYQAGLTFHDRPRRTFSTSYHDCPPLQSVSYHAPALLSPGMMPPGTYTAPPQPHALPTYWIAPAPQTLDPLGPRWSPHSQFHAAPPNTGLTVGYPTLQGYPASIFTQGPAYLMTIGPSGQVAATSTMPAPTGPQQQRGSDQKAGGLDTTKAGNSTSAADGNATDPSYASDDWDIQDSARVDTNNDSSDNTTVCNGDNRTPKNDQDIFGNADNAGGLDKNNQTTGHNNDWNADQTKGGQSWENGPATNSIRDGQEARFASGACPLHDPHGVYVTMKSSASEDVPAEAEAEPPRCDDAHSVVNTKETSKEVRLGKGYLYSKKPYSPEYLDTLAEPYARFVFKYRTKEQLKKELRIELEVEPTGDEEIKDLQNMDKVQLIDMLLRVKGALGGKIPSPSPKIAASASSTSCQPAPIQPRRQARVSEIYLTLNAKPIEQPVLCPRHESSSSNAVNSQNERRR